MYPNDYPDEQEKPRDYSRWLPWIYGCGCGCLMLMGFAILIAGMIWYFTIYQPGPN